MSNTYSEIRFEHKDGERSYWGIRAVKYNDNPDDGDNPDFTEWRYEIWREGVMIFVGFVELPSGQKADPEDFFLDFVGNVNAALVGFAKHRGQESYPGTFGVAEVGQ